MSFRTDFSFLSMVDITLFPDPLLSVMWPTVSSRAPQGLKGQTLLEKGILNLALTVIKVNLAEKKEDILSSNCNLLINSRDQANPLIPSRHSTAEYICTPDPAF